MEEKRKLLHEILDLVLDINGFEQRRRKYTGDKPTAFFRFNGHVCDIEVDIHEQGWEPAINPYIEYREYIDEEKANLQQIVDLLSKFKEIM